jgi:hypothetical protein
METRHKEILQKNRTFLVDQLEVSEILDYLFQENIITKDDNERLTMPHIIRRDKVKCMI